jgi:hypothetical protein
MNMVMNESGFEKWDRYFFCLFAADERTIPAGRFTFVSPMTMPGVSACSWAHEGGSVYSHWKKLQRY